ncbi:MAG: hypothetical protein K6C36_04285 [Clostridia bacterium]|nr:hypothetical protein [Clostridia bacterium]
MQKIKLDFCGFWGSFKKDDNLFFNILSKHFEVELSPDPDFVICSNRGDPFCYMHYDCVRLMFMGENLSPDFTCFDYVIGFDKLDFPDRYFRLPYALYFDSGRPWLIQPFSREDAERALSEKKHFCNFIYAHRSASGAREKLLSALSEYKPVVSPGSFMNNVGTKGCTWAEKNRYLRESKFTIACDSISYPGFVTEKLVQPFMEHSVPIYSGDPLVSDFFAPDAFIRCGGADGDSVKRAVERAAYLDSHDDEYIETLMRFPLAAPDLCVRLYAELEDFLVAVFSQPPQKAFRRVKGFAADRHEELLRECMRRNAGSGIAAKTKRLAKDVKNRLSSSK